MNNGVMNYETFKQQVEEQIKNYIQDIEGNVIIRKVFKNNRELDSITILNVDSSIAPTLYIDDMYEAYLVSQNFDDVMRCFADAYLKHLNNVPDIEPKIGTKEFIKDHVIMYLVNADHNKKLLESAPYIRYLDLAIMFRVVVERNNESVSSYILKNEIANSIGATVQEIFKWANENTFKMFNPKCNSMLDAIKETIPEEILAEMEELEELENNDANMYVATVESGVNGAVVMTNKAFLKEFADKIDDDFYILPSSVHEILLIPSSNCNDASELKTMVKDVNSTVLADEEFLSNSVYMYKRSLDNIVICSADE